MEYNNLNNRNTQDPFSDAGMSYSDNQELEGGSFDIFYWFFKLLKYWPLFLIGVVFAVGLAFLKNKSWVPIYRTTTRILIEENREQRVVGSSFFSAGSTNMSNQMIIYTSYDLVSSAVEKMNLSTSIYRKGRFKNIALYKNGAIDIRSSFVASNAYRIEFLIVGKGQDDFEISYRDAREKDVIIKGKYGTELQAPLFHIVVDKSILFTEKYEYEFQFLSKDQLVGLFMGQLTPRIYREGSNVMEVSLNSNVPERDIDFFNHLNEQFFYENLQRKNSSSERSIDFINSQLEIIKDSINVSESKLNQYQMQSGLYSQDKSGKAASQLESLDREKVELRFKKEYLAEISNYLKQNSSEILVDPTAMGVSDSKLSAYVATYNDILFNLKALKPENPIYKRYLTQLTDTRGALIQHITTVQATLRTEESNLNSRYRDVLGQVSSLPVKERQLLAKERDFKINDTYHTYLLQRRIECQIQMASNAPDNVILDKPRTTAIINGSAIKDTYLLFVSIALIIVIAGIFIREMLYNFTIHSRDDISKITKLPIIGTLEKSGYGIHLVAKSYPKSGFTESLRSIKSRLEYVVKKENKLCALVTSTEPGDGKTFFISNLASVCSFTKRKTIIIDCDLRRPAFSKEMGFEHEKGLSNYLAGQVTLDEILQTNTEFGFDILPAGSIPPNPSELLQSEKTGELIAELNEKYDYIFLDCSPAGLVSDAYFLSKLVDVVLFVVRSEKTHKNFFNYTIREFTEDHISNVVIVYNAVNLKASYSGYGNKSYYGKVSYYTRYDSYYQNNKKKS